MSGRPASHLQLRGGIFHFRMRVPREVKLRLGLSEVRCSLGTYSATTARLLAAIHSIRVKEAFEVIRCSDMTKEEARQLVRDFFAGCLPRFDEGYVPKTDDPTSERIAVEDASRKRLQNLHRQLVNGSYGSDIVDGTSRLAGAHGVEWNGLPAPRRQDLLEGWTRASIELERILQLRLRDRLSPLSITDWLFRDAINCTQRHSIEPPRTSPKGPKLAEAISSYLAWGKRKWTAKTLEGRRRQLRFVEEHFGSDIPVASITSHDVRGYRDAVCRLRSNHHLGDGKSFAERQTDNEFHRIQPKTAVLIFETCKAFFGWAKAGEGYIDVNPAEGVRLDLPKRVKGEKSRRPFSPSELETLFAAPLFRGCKSAKRLFQPGNAIIKQDHFWIIVLGYYTGARLGEIVQLHLGDVSPHGALPFIQVTETSDGMPDDAERKHVKSVAGLRRIPMHPDILELGFADFVASRQMGHRPSSRLFRRVPFGADGQPSTVFSKWFARFLDRVGLKARALVFHSFRHNMEDAFREALQQQYVIDRILGHSNSATSAGYGEGIGLETALKAICTVKLPISLPSFWSRKSRASAVGEVA